MPECYLPICQEVMKGKPNSFAFDWVKIMDLFLFLNEVKI